MKQKFEDIEGICEWCGKHSGGSSVIRLTYNGKKYIICGAKCCHKLIKQLDRERFKGKKRILAKAA